LRSPCVETACGQIAGFAGEFLLQIEASYFAPKVCAVKFAQARRVVCIPQSEFTCERIKSSSGIGLRNGDGDAGKKRIKGVEPTQTSARRQADARCANGLNPACISAGLLAGSSEMTRKMTDDARRPRVKCVSFRRQPRL
jgi:hypothetical protein